MSTTGSYQARQFNLRGLKGISDQTLEMHFKLYEGYVKETNNLTQGNCTTSTFHDLPSIQFPESN